METLHAHTKIAVLTISNVKQHVKKSRISATERAINFKFGAEINPAI